VLAAIGTIESGNGRDPSTSSAGAMGPMQFLPSTWAAYGLDADGDGRAEIMDPVDAVHAAARYLCDNGGGRPGAALAGAVYAYNHAEWYVRDVLSLAARIR
jgi:membrane-bound lytic murein transglycosylase B